MVVICSLALLIHAACSMMHASRPRFACLPGLHREHKKIEEYYARVSQRSHQQEHKAFLNSRKQWLQQHNEAGPDKKRLQNKKALLEAKKELSLVQSTGGKFKVPKQFVEKDAWKEDVRGPLDNAKLVKEVIFGKTVEGSGSTSCRRASMTLSPTTTRRWRSARRCTTTGTRPLERRRSSAPRRPSLASLQRRPKLATR